MCNFHPDTSLYGRRVQVFNPHLDLIAEGKLVRIQSPHRWALDTGDVAVIGEPDDADTLIEDGVTGEPCIEIYNAVLA